MITLRQVLRLGAKRLITAVGPVNGAYRARCSQLAIIYRGLELDFVWHDAVVGNARPTGDGGDAFCEGVDS